jgi:hypothetical protein
VDTTAVPEPKKTTPKSLAIQAGGAVLWGIHFSVIPGEITIFTVLVLIWREFARTKKHPFLPGFLVRAAVISMIVTAAVLAPLKSEDRRVEGLSGATVALQELSKAARMSVRPDEALALQVTLPSARPTVREAMRAVESQTNLRCTPGRCGTSVTPLWGAHIISIYVDPR